MTTKTMETYSMFDTHRHIKQLEKQAESIVELVRDSRNYDISKLATREQVAILETKITEAKYDLLKWMIPLLVTILGIAIAITAKLYL